MVKQIRDKERSSKKVEDLPDTLQNLFQINKVKQYGWAISHMFPDIYTPQRFPDQYKFPTHIMTNKYQKTLTIPSTKDFAIYFSPVADCFYNYQFHNPGEIYEGLNVTWDDSSYISYADNDSKATNTNDGAGKRVFTASANEKFANLSSWNFSSKGSTSLSKFKKIRLIGAYIKVTYTGKLEDRSGLVKVAMGVKGFTSPLANEEIYTEELHNFPKYQTFNLEEPIICRYRLTMDDFSEFGPYTPYSTIPFYIIYGKGLQEGSSVYVEICKHFEGIVVPEEEEFVSPVRASTNQLPLQVQMDFLKQYGEDSHIETPDEESHRNLKNLID